MPAKKKETKKAAAAKKSTAKKAPAKKSAAKKAPAKKSAAKKTPAKRSTTKKTTPVSEDEFFTMVREAAYFAAENDGHRKSDTDYWMQAESAVRGKYDIA
jgi:hypothetical protein